MDFVSLSSQFVRVSLDPRVGHLRDFAALHQGIWHKPLHTAHWVDDDECPDDLPNVERYLSGDFLCAPFAESDIDHGPFHGWPANSPWDLESRSNDAEACFVLRKKVMGARVEKHLRCAEDAPLLYQTHRCLGGDGALPVAHHVMTRMAEGGRITHSPKQLALTPETATEPGLNHLLCPARSDDLTAFPTENGTVDLGHYPLAAAHEDFVVLAEAPGADFAWTAVVRKAENDILFVLKDPVILPVTMLWYSNGGLTSPPWNGRHRGVLGIEDGCSGPHSGHAGSLAKNPLSKMGIQTALQLQLSRPVTIRHVIGVIQRPLGWKSVSQITRRENSIRIEAAEGGHVDLRFNANFFGE